MNPSELTAVVLIAGCGTRIRDVVAEPKSLLQVGGETIINRHLRLFGEVGIRKVILVVGYKKELILRTIEPFRESLDITIVANDDYTTLGNGVSLQMGIEATDGPVLVFDGDLIYARDILERFASEAHPTSVVVGKASIDDIECTKSMLDAKGFIRLFVDKRAVTEEELERFTFAGEAMGILKFSDADRLSLLALCKEFYSVPERQLLNWEHVLNCFLPKHDVWSHFDDSEAWIEIDTPEDYEDAKEKAGLLNKEG
ncbi:MAG: hypothetical protein CMO80_12630 [Verrucomicrobiales bacterium]|nr:hypothetical protein [Verrucomicrobiales bacterium]